MKLIRTANTLSLIFSTLFFSIQGYAQQSTADTTKKPTYPLQVVFVDYQAYSSDKGNVISWATILESHLVQYEIQRSTDNKTFEKIGTIKAKGNTSLTESYTFIDTKPGKGKNVYRLKMIDVWNGFKLSATKSVSWNANVFVSSDYNTYPNPAHAGNHIQVNVKESGKYQVQLFSLSGRLAYTTRVTGGGEAGFGFQLPAQIMNGMYMIRISQPGKLVQQHKLMVL